MTQPRSLTQATAPLTQDQVQAALLDITGDLDKALVLEKTIPVWLLKAQPEFLRAIEDAYRDSQRPRERVARLLKQLQPIDEFCRQLLKAFLMSKGLGFLDVDHDLLEIPRRTLSGVSPDLGGRLLEDVRLEKQSLLQAAMQNFPLARSQPDGLPPSAVIRFGGKREVLGTLKAHEFVGYCREMDVGESYQAYLREFFNLPQPGEGAVVLDRGYNPVAYDIGQSKRSDLKVNLSIACAKGDITESTYRLLLEVVRLDRPASELKHLLFNGRPLVWHGLNIRGTCIWSALVFCGDSVSDFVNGPVVMYLPNEPERPLYEYATMQDFSTYLTAKLRSAPYRSVFTRFLDESERFTFLQQFDENQNLGLLAPLPVVDSLTDFFFNTVVGKYQLDAMVLAVPVAQVDEDARQQRLSSYLDAGLTLLNVAGLFIPVLGQLMMGVAMGQLLGEVFDGVEDWQHHDNARALEHVINVAETLASLAVFAAGAKGLGAAKRALTSSPEFFDGMEAVKLADGKERLWRSSPMPYRQALALNGVIGNAKGVYQAHSQSFVKVDGSLYSIAYDGQIGRWRARHPLREVAYRPPLIHNRQGGWQFTFERPEHWAHPDYIFQRLDPGLGSLPSGHLQDIAAVTDTKLSHLKQLARENSPLSERFRDCAARFKQNQRVRDLRWQLEQDAPLDPTTAWTQLLALPFMEGWPQGCFFEVLDDEGNLLERFPDTLPFDYEDLSIHITEQQLKAGEVLPTALAALDDEEKRVLLGRHVEPELEQQVLKQRLMDSLRHSHRKVFDALYQYDELADQTDQTDQGLLKARYPELPKRVCWEIMSKASVSERLQLRQTGRVPLRVAQQAREALDPLLMDQALSGLYLPELANEATLRIVLGLAPRLEGWPSGLRLQLRDGTVTGRLLAQTGSDTATVWRTLIKVGEDFQALDERGAPLGLMTNGRDGLYQAIIDAVPADDLAGMQDPDKSQLRYRIITEAQQSRARASRFVWPQRAELQEPPSPCIQALPREPAQFPVALVRKVKKLYPVFNDQQVATFLEAVGEDHLSRAKAIKALEGDYQRLHSTLRAWTRERVESTSSRYTSADIRLSRLQALRAIENSWRYASKVPNEAGELVPGLTLDGLFLGALPALPPEVSFDHVQILSLNRLGLSDDVAYFLKHFERLQALELTGNQISRLPEVLSHMPALERLYLDSNRLQLTEYTRAKLANMRSLKVLNLSNNPLVDPPLVRNLFELQTLALRNCRLKEVPSGLLRVPYLERLDLRENDIETLPDWLYAVPSGLAEAINLRHNPLTLRSRAALRNYRDRVGVGMGFLEDDIARLNEQRARELWVPDERIPQFSEKNATWLGLKDEAQSDGLFKLLAELGGTADSTNVREDMERRVWRVLEAARADQRLREEIFERAATPLNCDDAAAVSFSNLEILVEIHDASQLVNGGQVTAGSLLKLGRGLFRLDRLERMARAHSAEHPASDPLEVSLAYRTGLVDRFYLPGQPRHMRFSRLAGVTQQALASAENRVKSDELSPELLKYLMDLPFWVRYLKRSFGRSFDSLNQPFDQRMHTVFEQGHSLDDIVYRDQMNEISREQAVAERAELERLTLEALRLDETSHSCVLPFI
ncbi:NEL-type E3 ubiquitin ligase domain-containing protein [Pseudomonas poae]|uniref:RING-type E3 ubiquitin transferase n=1 Tax=Pseudomonas poae TaxID=200451 RepID=A0A2S9EZX5_9PSED|nr:NEL-type E3 ubiquitin ligase domain-containing protein [Pseudomonas poae]PRA31419.1 hypothetical protein CQZ97_08285 [Pseudomonas poae]PRC23025.1 hypothetical protein CQZ99_01185 [Pseudomonas poae]